MTWGGLCNQVYAHLVASILAMHCGADIIVPPALKRNSFEGVFTGNASTTSSKYTMMPFASLFNKDVLFNHLLGMHGGVLFNQSNSCFNQMAPTSRATMYGCLSRQRGGCIACASVTT
jgi:hypothetical protein